MLARYILTVFKLDERESLPSEFYLGRGEGKEPGYIPPPLPGTCAGYLKSSSREILKLSELGIRGGTQCLPLSPPSTPCAIMWLHILFCGPPPPPSEEFSRKKPTYFSKCQCTVMTCTVHISRQLHSGLGIRHFLFAPVKV